MKAFLLVAGLGTRLRPLTNDIPKCLLPIGGKPLLQIWMEHLAGHGIDEVLINTHWRHERVEDFLRDFSGPSIQVNLFHESVLLGSAGTILANREWVAADEPFFILYGDNLTNVNLSRMLSFHRMHGFVFTLGVFKAENPTRCGIAQVGADDVVTEFSEKPIHPKSNLAAAGVYVADSRFFDFFPKKDSIASGAYDLGYHVIPRLVGNMKAYRIGDFLMDIGTPDSYERAQRLWKIRSNQVKSNQASHSST